MDVTRRRKVLVHVGTPKTGTSHLQDVLFRNQKVLAKQGVNYPADRFDAHFLAALDLMQLPWAGLEQEAVGAWDRLAAKVRDFDGTSIVSHEILAKASRTQVDRALSSFGGAEVHLVLSVRDLVRQIPAEWQENVKHRAQISYADFLATIQDPERKSRIGSWFWSVQEIPDIINRWGASLPPERIHLVTVPAPGAPRDELWSRFSRAFGLDGLEGLDLTPERANPSMGVPETTLVRRINRQVHQVLPPEHYRPLVRELLAHQTLSQNTRSPRLSLPPELEPWTMELSRTWVDEITARGYDVVGDVNDLLGVASGVSQDDWVDPDRPRPVSINRASLDAIEALLLEAARLREVEADLNRQLHETREALDRAYMRPSYKVREKAVRGLQRSAPGRAGLEVYRRLRGGANSFSA
ncbi:hypothetical protein E2C04_00990 [Nocardioides daphniae]|nr:hypothetical protein E2C04_00990 [Nocardioides daphniae]